VPLARAALDIDYYKPGRSVASLSHTHRQGPVVYYRYTNRDQLLPASPSAPTLKRQCRALRVATNSPKRLKGLEVDQLHPSAHPQALSQHVKPLLRMVRLTTSKMCSTSTIALLFPREKSAHSQNQVAGIRVLLTLRLKSVKISSKTIFFISNKGATMINIQRMIHYGIHGRWKNTGLYHDRHLS